jgi:glyoxylase I family protein
LHIKLLGTHHVAIISSNYAISKRFYTEILRLEIVSEVYCNDRDSYKLNLRLPDRTEIELFSFSNPPRRRSYPEACGLRHLAFAVDNLEQSVAHLRAHQVSVEDIRSDEYTGKKFTFFADPDGLPLELHEL